MILQNMFRIKFMTVRNPVEKIFSDVVQDLLAEASLGSGKPLPSLQMFNEYASIDPSQRKEIS